MKVSDIDNSRVIASFDDYYYSIYTFVDDDATEEDVQQLIHKAETFYTHSPELNKKYKCVTFKEYQKAQAEHFMQSCKAITEQRYWEMFEVLPPIYVKNFEIESYPVLGCFIVMEPLTSIYYDAYLRYKNHKGETKFASKVVARGCRDTYFTKEDLDRLEGEDANR